MATVVPFPTTESDERARLCRLLRRLQQNGGLPPDIEIELSPLLRQGGFTLSLTGTKQRLLAENLVGADMFPRRRSWYHSYRKLRDAWWYVRRVGVDRWHVLYYCRGPGAEPATVLDQ